MSYEGKETPFAALVGETLSAIEGEVGDDTLTLKTASGRQFQMVHYADCCENVELFDVVGDLADLIGHPILQAEEVSTDEDPPDITAPDYRESFTWTFYKLATIKGSVTLRWLGTSNGYYSESVEFNELKGG